MEKSDDGTPLTDIVPASGVAKPSSAAKTDDFPAPEGPMRASRVPGGAWSATPSKAGFVRFS